MSQYGYTDKPISSLDNDSFGVGNYIEGLCEFILKCDTPMTISLQGSWGSGKTSMMNMIKNKIEDQIIPVWFNTWQFSQFNMSETLSISMLSSLILELKKQCKDDKKSNERLDQTYKIVKILGNVIKKASLIAIDSFLGGRFADTVEHCIPSEDKGNSIDLAQHIIDLKESFQNSVNEVIANKKLDRIVVFVDDLDRLQPAKAVELLEVLKLFLDCEKCIFILAVDYEVVTQGIMEKYGQAVGFTKGKSFFDKIIQLPFKVPVAEYNISEYVNNLLKMDISSEDKTITDLYVSLIQKSIGLNPRSMKRLFNTYQLLNKISQKRENYQSNPEKQKILFATICMQMAFDELFSYIVLNKETLDTELLETLSSFDKIKKNEELIHELGIKEDDDLRCIADFMAKFNEAIQLDNDANISERELANLKEILSFSTVTALNTENKTTGASELDRNYRYMNKELALKVNEKLKKSTPHSFTIWQPRKAGEGKLSDTSSYTELISKAGTSYYLEYQLRADYDSNSISVDFKVYTSGKKRWENFITEFGENPLKLTINPIPIFDGKGFVYHDVINLPADAAGLPDSIVKETVGFLNLLNQ